MFRWAHPTYLQYLWLPVVLLVLFIYLNYTKKKKLEKFSSKELLGILIPDYSFKKTLLKQCLIVVSIVLLITCLAAPQIGAKFEDVKQTGSDVYILLDVSLSMKAKDVPPSRLDNAKLQIENLISNLKGDRIGLIVFSGEAYVQFPLTNDYSAARLFLNAIDESTVPQHGTSISSALNLAVNSFDNKPSDKAVVIITDGEDHEGNIFEEIENGQEKNIKFYFIGIGTKEGKTIPVGNQVKIDFYGDTVITKLDDKVLKEIALKGGGKYYQANGSSNALMSIYSDLGQLKKAEYGTKRVTAYEDRYYYFLFPA
ncbi:MAG: VWA domain-containing protein, partial [Bacteroidota bacterium]|nr:VWA domain-containing protein [Bacteroidota bacterium]